MLAKFGLVSRRKGFASIRLDGSFNGGRQKANSAAYQKVDLNGMPANQTSGENVFPRVSTYKKQSLNATPVLFSFRLNGATHVWR